MASRSTLDQESFQHPEQMRDVFQQFLVPIDGSRIDVQTCRIDYARQSATRSVYQYTLGILHAATGVITEQIVTGMAYTGGKTRAHWRRVSLEDENALRPVGPLLLPAATYVPALDLLVQTFPYDYRLPGLIELVNGSPAFVNVLLGENGPGDWQVEKWEAEVVRYRPDMRAMVRVGALARAKASEEIVARNAFAKVYREEEEGRRVFGLLAALWEKTAGADLGFAVPRPIAYVDAQQTLLMGEARGVRLLQRVRKDEPAKVIPAIRLAARAVAGLHQLSLPEGMLPFARMEKAKQLSTVANTLAEYSPAHEAAIDELVLEIGRVFGEGELAPTHFDLKQGHILLDDARVTILDFDKMALGDPLVDVANIAATLGAERERSHARLERRAGLAGAFIDEYFTHVPDSWRERFPARYALATLVEAGTTGRGQRGRPEIVNHADRVASAIVHAQQVMAGGID